MTTLSPEVRADLRLLQRQTAEVRRALAHTHRLGAERSATVLRLRDRGVTYRIIAAAMGSSVAAVQSILTRAEHRVTAPTAPTVMSAGGVVGTAVTPTVGAAGGVRAAGVMGAGATLTQKAGAR
ncbi:RNA polymerase sigma factor [Mycobacteroides abscessus]|uniref:hypothetical protein n=1 Tax=Mycobacteroides abscessus TaxID=36809 RepID=UPI0010426D7D|nr:hypothetical protein [Mycobacteroides abscessus]MDM2173427.1 hypothetical protein [Mycobacteroides abscessus]MDM2176302.1 hypothetical protein [Mycobacteroides abscessus]MDM2204867.1 hypothetical protein [Mycobacteroides abscessus]MDM2213855.1 hypothetical protein [Mycobacteroides abscessus]MDM2215786.1 hypothetical protein [Mycobacteroides abscessus]